MKDYNNHKQVIKESLKRSGNDSYDAQDAKLPWEDKNFVRAFVLVIVVLAFYITVRVLTTSC